MKKTPRKYVSQKAKLQEFNRLAEEFTARFKILVGAERCSGDVDSAGKYYPPAVILHVNGLAFRVESYTHASAFLRGVECGFDFRVSTIGPGYVSRSEVVRMIQEAIQRLGK